jgi:hypothetical protein
MSFEAMAWAVKKELPAMQKLVLLLLANRTNADTGQCTPSHDRLAKDCGMTSRSVKAQIAKLAEGGYLTVTPRTKEGLSLSNQYTLAIWEQGGNQVPPRGNDVPGGGEPRSYLGGNYVPTKQEEETISETGNTYIAPKAKKYAALPALKALGIEEQTAADWLEIRKLKKKPQIQSQIESVIAQLAAAGYGPQAGIDMCVKKNWATFEAEWLTNSQPQRQQSSQQQPASQRLGAAGQATAANAERLMQRLKGDDHANQ